MKLKKYNYGKRYSVDQVQGLLNQLNHVLEECHEAMLVFDGDGLLEENDDLIEKIENALSAVNGNLK